MFTFSETIQLLAWLIALIELSTGLYILLLNSRHTANRHASILLVVLSVYTFAIGALAGAQDISGTYPAATRLLAALTPALPPIVLLTSTALIKPGLMRGRWSWAWWIPRIMAILPAVLTLVDVLVGTDFWYARLDPYAYSAGFIPMARMTGGVFKPLISNFNISLMFLVSMAVILYLAEFDRSLPRNSKRLAWWLFGANLLVFIANVSAVTYFTPLGITRSAILGLVTSSLYMIAYTTASFQQMVSKQRLNQGSLRVRLTALILVSMLPLLVFFALVLTNRARIQMERSALQNLMEANRALADSTGTWLDFNLKSLQNLVNSPAIISMDPVQQKPLLELMARTYPHMYLVSTTRTNGFNVARNDDNPLTDYSDRAWVQGALNGASVTYQTLIGRTSGQPALVVSMPIRNRFAEIVGVGMFASDLDEISHLVTNTEPGEGGISYIIDAQNVLVAHPDPTMTAELTDMSDEPAVRALRGGEISAIHFTDENDHRWRAEVSRLPNGWGVVVQQPEATLFAPIRNFQRLATLMVVLVGALLFGMSYSTIRQGLQPIQSLTETASAITAGDLTREAPVESLDELGVLAESFNMMTAQLRELITGLERRVSERTKDLERRAVQLQVTAEVAREAAAIRDLEDLLDHIVRLISDRFGFYHAGIFLVGEGSSSASDETVGYAILRAASSEGGQRMLARQHMLEIGQVGIVGYVAGAGLSRIALDVGEDAVFFNNPDLPETRSEMALPLMIQERVIGVLDVQSREAEAFSEEDVATLQILADQVALAIENARLFAESELALRELETLYGMQIRSGWQEQLAESSLAFVYDHSGVKPANPEHSGEALDEAAPDRNDQETIQVAIDLHGEKLGMIRLTRKAKDGDWSSDELRLVEGTVSQLALAIENARLLEEIQNRANMEELINQIISKAQFSFNLESVMRTVVEELGQTVNAAKVQIRLGEPPGGLDTLIDSGDYTKTSKRGSTGKLSPLDIPTRPRGNGFKKTGGYSDSGDNDRSKSSDRDTGRDQ